MEVDLLQQLKHIQNHQYADLCNVLRFYVPDLHRHIQKYRLIRVNVIGACVIKKRSVCVSDANEAPHTTIRTARWRCDMWFVEAE